MCAETHPTAGGAGGPEPSGVELLDVKQVADLLHCSTRSVYRLADAGKMPRPVRLGSLVRWRSGELRRWIEAGCPAARKFRSRSEEVSL